MTRRERLERKLERREEWAEGRDRKAADLERQNEPYRGDVAFNTQPGHIPERARAIRRSEKAAEHVEMARHHREKAGGLRDQLDRSIFSDDPDALEKLEAKIHGLMAQKERWKALNTAWRKAGKPGGNELNRWRKLEEEHGAKLCEQGRRNLILQHHGAPFPSYLFSNTSGTIRAAKKRLDSIRSRQDKAERASRTNTGVLIEGNGEWITVTFAEKPDTEVLHALRAAGFWWAGGAWHGKRDELPGVIPVSDPQDGPAR